MARRPSSLRDERMMKSDQPDGLDHADAVARRRSRGRSRARPRTCARGPPADSSTVEPHGLVVGQVVARRARRCPCGRRSGRSELVELGVAAVGALGRGGQAEPERREARRAPPARRSAPGRWWHSSNTSRPKRSPEVLHVQVGRVVGGDGQRLHVVVAAADQADRRRRRSRAARRTTGAPDRASARRPACCAACRRWPGRRRSVLPAPVGSTTTPRPRCARQAASASAW